MESSGLQQLGARFYWPELGRFIQQDPIGDGVNWYAYVGSNPVVWVDPSGLWEIGGEYYAGYGFGFYLGRDHCGAFYVKAKAGFGLGGFVGLDPYATSPSYRSGAGRGSFWGLAARAGFRLGYAGVGADESRGTAYDRYGNPHPYGPSPEPLKRKPTLKAPRRVGVGIAWGLEGGFRF